SLDFSLRRSDGCHFSSDGNLAHALLWLDVLRQYDLEGRPSASAPAVDIGSSQGLIPSSADGTATLLWSSQNVAACPLSDGPPSPAPKQSLAVTPNTAMARSVSIAADRTYTISCTTQSSATLTKSVTVHAAPLLITDRTCCAHRAAIVQSQPPRREMTA